MGWFVVLPDHEDSASVLTKLDLQFRNRFLYPSGRPFIVGHLEEPHIQIDGIARKTVLIGRTSVNTHSQKSIRQYHSLENIHSLHSLVPGSFHVISVAGSVASVSGTISSIKRIFYARVGKITIGASRTDILSLLSPGHLQLGLLATHLLYTGSPHPFADRSPVAGIEAVPAGCALELRGDGSAQISRWWSPPEPNLTLREAAPLLREELINSIKTIEATNADICSDLSGGLDSTAVSYAASRVFPKFRVLTTAGGSGADDDLRWAQEALPYIRNAIQFLIPPEQLPLPYSDLNTLNNIQVDEPYIGSAAIGRLNYLTSCLANSGLRTQLTGHGGDEVLQVPECHIYELARSKPIVGLPRIFQLQAIRKCSLIDLCRSYFDASTYDHWIRNGFNNLSTHLVTNRAPTRWGGQKFYLPPWSTRNAVHLVKQLMFGEREIKSLAQSPSQHAALESISSGGRNYRLMEQVMEQQGVRMVAPFTDHRVVQLCISVIDEEKWQPRTYKPLIVAAMNASGIPNFGKRRSKPNYSIDVFRGRKRYLDELIEYFSESILAELGLVDANLLRIGLLDVGERAPQVAIWRTLACEAWLRSNAGRWRQYS